MASNLSPNSSFIVKDSVYMYLFIALMFGGMIYSGVNYYSGGNWALALGLAVMPLMLALYKAKTIRPAIVVNIKGIFASGKLITDWRHFANAHFTQKQKIISIKDNFVLIVQYYRDDVPGTFKSTIPLANTQNKSEEAVIEAIKYYFGLYKQGLSS